MMQMPAAMLTPRTRRMLLFAALVLTLIAVFAVDGGEEAGQEAVPANVAAPREGPRAEGSAGRSRAAPLSVAAPQPAGERALPSGSQDPFGLAAWTPEVQQAAEAREREKRAASEPAPPPPPPMAPALPFTFFGQMIDGAKRQVFLNHGNRTLIVSVGESIDNNYRVDRIDDTAVHFTYLPLGQKQILAIPGPK